MPQRHHTIDYFELTAADLPAAMRFYAAAFGLEFQEYGDAYAGIRGVDGGEVGGIRHDAEPAAPLVVLYSDDLESSLEAVERAGGRITKPVFSFPGGRRFHFVDPGGNELAVWSAR